MLLFGKAFQVLVCLAATKCLGGSTEHIVEATQNRTGCLLRVAGAFQFLNDRGNSPVYNPTGVILRKYLTNPDSRSEPVHAWLPIGWYECQMHRFFFPLLLPRPIPLFVPVHPHHHILRKMPALLNEMGRYAEGTTGM